jgi:hypothetical protein
MDGLISRLITQIGEGGNQRFLYMKKGEGGICREEVLEGAYEVGAVLAHDLRVNVQRAYVDILRDAESVAHRSDFYLCPIPSWPKRFYAVVVTDSK